MRGDGAAIRLLRSDVIHHILHHFPSALGGYHLNRAAIAQGLVIYVAMALSPHFELFILNCFIVYLPLVHECFYFHTVSVFVHLRGSLPFLFQLYGILFFTFQQNDIPGKPACLEFYPCSKLVLYVVVVFLFFFHPTKCFTVS